MGQDCAPAFPEVPGDNNAYEGCSGMSRRDWFAGQALAGLASRPMHPSFGEDLLGYYRAQAAVAYHMADAMLAAGKAG